MATMMFWPQCSPWSGGLIPGNDRHGKEDAAHGYRRPLDGDWFDVSLDEKAPVVPPAVDVPVLDLPPDVPAPNVAPANVLTDALLTAPPVAPAVAPFEVSGRVDLSWTPTEPPAAPSPVADFPSQDDRMDAGMPPTPAPPMAAPLATTQPVEAFLAESTAENAYVPPPPMDFASAAGGFPQGAPMEAPLAPVNDWGFPPTDTLAMPHKCSNAGFNRRAGSTDGRTSRSQRARCPTGKLVRLAD